MACRFNRQPPKALYSVQLSILEDIESKEFIWHPFGNKTRCKDYLRCNGPKAFISSISDKITNKRNFFREK